MESIQTIKQRFGIIGNNPQLHRALEKAIQVAPSDISVMVSGESGVGKEFIPKIIHALSIRKHHPYIAVNCGAIPEGTIDSELFGHEKGAFTGATNTRKGYFEVADQGTIFLDEVGELPLFTQVRLLRVLESGEFIKVGASQVQKTNVRIVAATNVNMLEAVKNGKFREDLYYRLNTIQIDLPSLRTRSEDIPLLYLKFAQDFAEKYHRPMVRLSDDAMTYIQKFYWPGNVRQLRNFAEQVSVLSQAKEIDLDEVSAILPFNASSGLVGMQSANDQTFQEREIFYKVLLDMKHDLNDLRSLTLELLKNQSSGTNPVINPDLINRVMGQADPITHSTSRIDYQTDPALTTTILPSSEAINDDLDDYEFVVDVPHVKQSLSIHDTELDLIMKALKKYKGKRKLAAEELGISERTLYRKIKQYDL